MHYLPARLIEKKRDGDALSRAEIRDLVGGITDGTLSDAQLGALLMAGFLRGSTMEEVRDWTEAMRDSGKVHDFSDLPGRKVDKHSTGGVGDKVSLVLGPLAAAMGVLVPMVSGRGLGHTGGTVDKLGSIPGFRMDMDSGTFRRLLATHGLVMAAATGDLAPADRRMYATRDVTATVPHLPWIVSSILSKKLAEGIDALVLDVKCGRGAFMKDPAEAGRLAEALVRTAGSLGCRAMARITNMDRPLGRTVGNALEVREALECLRGGGPEDLRECVLLLASDMAVLADLAEGEEEARRLARKCLEEGRALETFAAMVEAQGGDPAVVEDPGKVLPKAPILRVFEAPRGGFYADLDPLALGWAGVVLGAGRKVASDSVDPAVGFVLLASLGDRVERGCPLIEIHARDEGAAERAALDLAGAVRIEDEEPAASPLLLGTIRPENL